jgi:hypothetical protein
MAGETFGPAGQLAIGDARGRAGIDEGEKFFAAPMQQIARLGLLAGIELEIAGQPLEPPRDSDRIKRIPQWLAAQLFDLLIAERASVGRLLGFALGTVIGVLLLLRVEFRPLVRVEQGGKVTVKLGGDFVQPFVIRFDLGADFFDVGEQLRALLFADAGCAFFSRRLAIRGRRRSAHELAAGHGRRRRHGRRSLSQRACREAGAKNQHREQGDDQPLLHWV